MSSDTPLDEDERFMRQALELANEAAVAGEVPVGAIVVKDGEVIGRGANSPIGDCDPSAHAEVLAIRDACKNERNYRIPDATLYVTIEPCTMCLGTIMHTRIKRVVFGASEPKAGVIESHPNSLNAGYFNHQITYRSGVLGLECAQVISDFFEQRRRFKAQLKASTKT